MSTEQKVQDHFHDDANRFDAIYEEEPVPAKYIGIVASYTLCYTTGILALAVALFQRRQVG